MQNTSHSNGLPGSETFGIGTRQNTNSNKRTSFGVRMGRKVIAEEQVESELRQLSSSPAEKIGLLIGQVGLCQYVGSVATS